MTGYRIIARCAVADFVLVVGVVRDWKVRDRVGVVQIILREPYSTSGGERDSPRLPPWWKGKCRRTRKLMHVHANFSH